MSNQDLSKIKGQTPVSIIVHGGNYISYLLAKTLLEQGSHVVIIDKYTNSSKQYFTQLKKTGKVSFIDFKGLKSFYEKIARIDYLYYMLGEKTQETTRIDSKDFLAETDYLNTSLNAANKYKAKISLITSLRLNRELSNRINNQQDGKTKPYSPLELQRYGENYAAEFVDKTKANLRIIRLGTVVGKGVSEIRDKILHKLLTDATQKHQIEIEGEGLEIHNLIHESDAIYGILKLTFSDETKGEVVSLCNKNDYTTLSLAYKLLELDVESRAIKFIERDDTSTILQDLYVPAPNAQQFGWKQNISLEESIVGQIQAYYESSDKKWEVDKTKGKREDRKQSEISNVSKTKLGVFVHSLLSPFKALSQPEKLFHSINYLKIFRTIFLSTIAFFLIYFLIAPLIGISLGGYLIYSKGSVLRESVNNLDFEKIQEHTDSISRNTLRVESNFNRIYWIFKVTNTRDTYKNLDQIVQGTKYIGEGIHDLVISLRPLGEYLKDFEPSIALDRDTQSIKEYSQYLKATDDNRYVLREGIYKMSLAQNLITSVDTRKVPNVIKDFVIEYKDLITQINNTVKPLEKVSQFIPDILGVNERQRYLILLQDNGELRSTGGWISSYGVIAIEGGQIREMFVDDIYGAQTALNLQGHSYKTPSSLLRAFKDTPYSFPLVNWDPNLDNVLLSSEQFIYDLEKGNDLDGVIVVDTVLIQKLLDKWGGVEVPGENELVTSENLYSKIFENTQGDSPSATRKSVFLTDLFDVVLKKVFSSKIDGYKEIYEIFSSSLDEKHMSFTFKNSTARGYADDNGWDGNLDSKFNSAPINIDWNWGLNKANLYIKKNHTLDIDIKDESAIEYKYQIGIQNDSTKDVYPEGEYVNYLRVYIPYNATVTGIKGFDGNKYDVYEENGYKIIGGWFNTPINETKLLEIKYRIVKDSNSTNFFLTKTDTHYEMDIDIYKQPGSKKDAYNISINYPTAWNIESSENLTRIESSINGRFELSSDKNFFISWQR